MLHVHMQQPYLQRGEILTCATSWMNLEDIRRETNKSQKGKQCKLYSNDVYLEKGRSTKSGWGDDAQQMWSCKVERSFIKR